MRLFGMLPSLSPEFAGHFNRRHLIFIGLLRWGPAIGAREAVVDLSECSPTSRFARTLENQTFPSLRLLESPVLWNVATFVLLFKYEAAYRREMFDW